MTKFTDTSLQAAQPPQFSNITTKASKNPAKLQGTPSTFTAATNLAACPFCGVSILSTEMTLHLEGCINPDMFPSDNQVDQNAGVVDTCSNKDKRLRGDIDPGEGFLRDEGGLGKEVEMGNELCGEEACLELPERSMEDCREEGVVYGNFENGEKDMFVKDMNEVLEEKEFSLTREEVHEALGFRKRASSYLDTDQIKTRRVDERHLEQMFKLFEMVKTFPDFVKPYTSLPTLEELCNEVHREEEREAEKVEEKIMQNVEIWRKKHSHYDNAQAPSRDGEKAKVANELIMETCPVCTIRVSKHNLEAHVQMCLESSGLGDAFT